VASDTETAVRRFVHRVRSVIPRFPYRYEVVSSAGQHNRTVARQRRRPSWDEYGREIGVRLQRARERRGLSQERTAHLAGIASYTYQKLEKGESRPGSPLNPRLSTLLALCQVLEVPLVELVPEPTPDVGARD
jgi:DNA-binding XRE family transcriptional regulator